MSAIRSQLRAALILAVFLAPFFLSVTVRSFLPQFYLGWGVALVVLLGVSFIITQVLIQPAGIRARRARDNQLVVWRRACRAAGLERQADDSDGTDLYRGRVDGMEVVLKIHAGQNLGGRLWKLVVEMEPMDQPLPRDVSAWTQGDFTADDLPDTAKVQAMFGQTEIELFNGLTEEADVLGVDLDHGNLALVQVAVSTADRCHEHLIGMVGLCRAVTLDTDDFLARIADQILDVNETTERRIEQIQLLLIEHPDYVENGRLIECLLVDEDPRIRLVTAGLAGERGLATLVEIAASRAPQAEQALELVVKKFGKDRALPIIQKRLHHPDEGIRYRTAVQVGEDGFDVLADLARGGGDLWLNALDTLLSTHPLDRVRPVLEACLRAPRNDILFVTVGRALRTGVSPPLEAVQRAARGADFEQLETLANWIGDRGDGQYEAVLTEWVDTENQRARIAVINALRSVGTLACVPRLKDEIVGRINTDVEEAAAAAIETIQERVPTDQSGHLSVATTQDFEGELSLPKHEDD